MPDDGEQTYRIGEVAARTTLSKDTLRYYDGCSVRSARIQQKRRT